ncbi:glycerol kinase GlpK [Pelistega europaea]|uniref:Glycerol kinase n=1 Tax=Pelistega europaea TaxID=106147 RepID=A0A7Y4LBA4_9BURK|nr:glycerol kinase GlpK [Pelistega europaea]NOL49151.1 glycerol kinase GlpK [Pelistega europaea]
MSYLLALDQGTTSSRSIIFNQQGHVVASAQLPINISTPHAAWVEQDALEIWSSQLQTIQQVLQKANIQAHEIRAIGIANQRETTVVWNKKTGLPIAPAIVWQDRRTATYCQQLKDKGHETHIRNITGLIIDPYFSASKIAWILDSVPGARAMADAGELAFGTVDSWLIWNLSGGFHATDVSNASRTMLMDIHTQQWSRPLLTLFKIPESLLPKIVASGQEIASTKISLLGAEIPIFSAIGDQQAALFGHDCHQAGMAKNTYGTGCFMLLNTGEHIIKSSHKLLSTVAWQRKGQQATQFALEGSVFMAGAIVQWLRDNLGFIKQSHEVEQLASQVKDSDGVVLVPAFTGLGAPYWEPNALASISGLSRGTHKAHIARAALEAIAFQVADVLHAMQQDAPTPLTELRVDGGASANNLLMQFQADILGVPVLRPTQTETTALGAVKLAGISCGFFNETDFTQMWQLDRCFEPQMNEDERRTRLEAWKTAVAKVLAH